MSFSRVGDHIISLASIKLQRIRHRRRLPSLFLRKLLAEVRENVRQVANPYRTEHTCFEAFPRHLKIFRSSSDTGRFIFPEELRIDLLRPYQVFQLFQARKRPVFKDLFRHVNPFE